MTTILCSGEMELCEQVSLRHSELDTAAVCRSIKCVPLQAEPYDRIRLRVGRMRQTSTQRVGKEAEKTSKAALSFRGRIPFVSTRAHTHTHTCTHFQSTDRVLSISLSHG